MQHIPLILSILSLAMIFIINFKLKNELVTRSVNLIFFAEFFVLSFLFEKYPVLFSLPVFLVSSYFIYSNSKSRVDQHSDHKFIFKQYFILFGLTVIFLLFLYEIFYGDGELSTDGLMVIMFALLFIFYHDIPRHLETEKRFFICFLGFNVTAWVLISLYYKFKLNSFTEDFGLLGGSDSLTQRFLANPLTLMLNLFGYYSFSSDGVLTFVDRESGKLVSVAIAESCSGLYSTLIFIFAFFSYVIADKRQFNLDTILFVCCGILISYFANLFRMFVVILSGHYYGQDILKIVHEYFGWIIFSFWIFIFWMIVFSQIDAERKKTA